ncbi:MAG: major capsid protein [Betaproteobacteria bacterium]|nr:major capsid protein [Betaproteobacteria bacterium]
MPITLDIFRGDAFSIDTLTAAINNPPEGQIIPPSPVDFDEEGVTTLSVMIEREGDSLSLVPATERGSPGDVTIGGKRDMVPFALLHLQTRANVMADEVQGVRAFGSTTETQMISDLVNKRLLKMRSRIDATLAFHRFGALTGKIYDANGENLLLDLFHHFGITQQTMSLALGASGTNIQQKIRDVKRIVENSLSGSANITGWRAVCGRGFYDAFVSHAKVEEAFNRWNDGAFLRSSNMHGFEFGEVSWKPWYGKVGNTLYIDPDVAYLVPVGIPGLFISRFGPADYIETVNTLGLPYYAKQEVMDFDKGIMLEAQSNPLNICTKPRAIIKLTK